MAATATGIPALAPFHIEKQFLDGKADASISVESLSPTIRQAIETDSPFPPGTIKLGEITAGVSGDSGDLPFGGATGPVVSFRGSAKGGGGLGVYQTSVEMLNDIAGTDSILDSSVTFPDHGTARYLALNWNYNINAAASGGLALGQVGQVKFGAEASSAGRFIVIRRFGAEPHARSAIQNVITAWRLPRQINGIDDMEPGSWIVAEVNGGFSASLGAEIGLDYSWVRSVNLQGLSGDIGLKIQAAAEVAVGFDAAGKYAIVISRESLNSADKQIRVRVCKLAKKGWDFALHAQVGVETSTGKLLPASLDDFVNGIFGVHGPQIVEDLKELDRWTDPSRPLNTLAGDFLVDLADKKFGGQLRAAFQEATEFLKAWDGVGPRASSLLWSLVSGTQAGNAEEKTAVNDKVSALTSFLNLLAAADNAGLTQLVLAQLATPESVPGPARKWLEAVTPNGTLAALGSEQQLARIRELATLSLRVLGGSTLLQLARFANEQLNLQSVENVSFDDLKPRLKEKLSQFLGKTLDQQSFEQVRTAIRSVREKSGDLYQAALKAANKKYSASLLAKYQSGVMQSALFDAVFDFAGNSALGGVLNHVIGGDFRTDGVFTNKIDGLTLNQGQLTHGINRQTSLEVNLPFVSLTMGSITQSLAAMNFRPDGTRITVDSSNEVFKAGAWGSRLAIHMDIPVTMRSTVRSFADSDELGEMMSASYQFVSARPKLGAVQLQKQLEPIVAAYLPNTFGQGKATLQEWIVDLDKNSDAVEDNGTGQIGNTIVMLEASLPGRVLAGWVNAPADGRSPVYKQMSKNIQATLRRLIPYVYFLDLSRYRGQQPAACALLLYASLPIATSVRKNGNSLEFDTGKDVYWDWRNVDPDGDRSLMVNNTLTDRQLTLELDKASQVLANSDMASDAKFYAQTELADIKHVATTSMGRVLLEALLFIEAEIIAGAVDAGKRIGEFFTKQKEEDALAKIDEFAADIVTNFNKHLTDLFDPKNDKELLRNLGLAVFLEAARALHPTLNAVPPAARLEIQVVRSAIPFPPAGFPLDYSLKPSEVVIDQPILSVSAAA